MSLRLDRRDLSELIDVRSPARATRALLDGVVKEKWLAVFGHDLIVQEPVDLMA